ncbi:MAG: ketol-acid reductoisomerase [Verrucomicrobia bacterium]|nr:MAG: ketol-acid reductoisomerase [Verrucomicrobiota bacterium]
MRVRIYRDKQIRLDALRGKVCGVIGFGSQGHAHALNLRDNGFNVVVGLRRNSKRRRLARAHHLPVLDLPEAVERSDIIFLALPDTTMPGVFRRQIAPHFRIGQTLLFAHGFTVVYKTVVPPPTVDIIMVAPKGLGQMVRREFVAGRGVPALVAVEHDFTGQARAIAFAWAKAIGCARAGVIETTFREETETDLFGEQAVLCGGTTALIHTAFETLVRAGYAPELAYFECLHELKFIVDMIHEVGIAGMRDLISDTAKWGDLTVGPRIVDQQVTKNMRAALEKIRSGEFAREFIREMETGQRRYHALLQRGRRQPIEKTGQRLRALMNWRKNK